ncbi:MAG: spore germination protein [Clostridia bacterium]|nr:spore germination protein [Clostridia bacterium]
MKIKSRQLCFILIAYTAVTKLLIYPTVLATFCDRDVLIPAVINFFIEGVLIWAVSFLCSRTDKTFFELLQGTIGRIGAKIVYGFFAAFFMLATIIPIFEQKLYVHAIFYDTVPSLIVFLPFFVFAVYAGAKNFQNTGRCADMCLPLFIFTMLFIFFMSWSEVEWSNLLPMFTTPAQKLFTGAAGSSMRFIEPCWLLMFMGHFNYRKGDAARLTLSYVLGALITLLFLAVFVGIYGDIASSRTFAISRTSIFFSAIDTIGRIDLIMLYVLEIVMLFAVVLNIQLAVHALKLCTGYENSMVLSVAVNAALMIVLIVCDNYFHNIQEFYFRWMWIAFLIFGVAIPALSWVLRRRNER